VIIFVDHGEFVVHSLILASNSPRRAALLTEAGYQFVIVAPDPERESGRRDGESAEDLVVRLAEEKAMQVAELLRRSTQSSDPTKTCLILAADTVVECGGEILGKPTDRDDARRILRQLRGRTHRVLTGVCLLEWPRGRTQADVDLTTLQMDWLDDAEIERYLDGDRWQGKAGAFGFQDGNDWVQIVDGSPSNVVGLPLELVERMLRGL
jgi:septum formation protein